MATLKQGEKDYLEEHSKEKVAFYEKYLNRYLTVLLNAKDIKVIHIYDLFCGIGIYDGDGSKGSPVVAMESIKNQQKIHWRYKNKPINLLINDWDSKKVKIAKEYIEKNFNNQFVFNAQNLPAEKIFPVVIDKIQKSRKDESHLVFIDPHGYKEIRKSDITGIMRAGRSEMLIFLPIHMMYRFLKPTKQDQKNPSYIPLRRFMEEFGLDYNAPTVIKYISLITQAFSFGDQYYTANYTLQANSSNYYALFFITKHIKGLEKAIETKWELDELCGKGFEKQVSISLFEMEDRENKKEDCIGEFKHKLYDFLCSFRTNNEIYEFTLKNGFMTKHTRDILKKFNSENILYFDRDSRRNAFYLDYKYYKKSIVRYRVKINE